MRRTRRTGTLLGLTLVILLLAACDYSYDVYDNNGGGPNSQALINHERGKAGLPALAWSGCLGSNAQLQAIWMGTHHMLQHNGVDRLDLACAMPCCHIIGAENLAQIPAPDNVWAMNVLWADAGHRNNILDPRARWFGAWWVYGGPNQFYLAEEFG